MKNTIVYIPNEIKVREFDGKLLLSLFLVNDNFSVKIGSRSGIKRELLYSRNGIYIPKSLTIAQVDFYKKLKKNGHKLVVMHSEGSILLKDIKEELLSMYPIECSKFIDMYLVSGNEIKEMMLKYTPYIDKDKIFVVGDPRFDLIKPKYDSYWKDDVNKLLKSFGDYILVNTNFATGNSKIGNENLKKFILQNPDYTQKFKKVRIKKQTFINNIMILFIDAINILSKEFPSLNFIIRPHPSESHEPYVKAFLERKNVIILHEGNVVKWILGAKAILHYDCTTGIEALLANKPSISFTPKIDKSILAWLPVLASKNILTIVELKKILNKIKTSDLALFDIDQKTQKILNNYLFNFCDESSSKIVNVLKKIKFEQKKEYFLKDEYKLIKQRLKSSLNLFFYSIGIIKEKGTASLRKFSYITKKEVSEKLLKSSKIHQLDSDYNISILGSNVAFLRKK